MGEHPDELEFLQQVSQTAKEVLSLELEYFGFIFADPAVRESIKKNSALIPFKRQATAARNIACLAERIAHSWQDPIPDSAELLVKQTRQVYEKEMGERKVRL